MENTLGSNVFGLIGDPIIVTGMHRAGTTLLSVVLEDMGVFMGANKDDNNEPLHIIKINDWLLNSVGARWDFPRDTSLLLENEKLANLVVNYLRYNVYGLAGLKYRFGCNSMLWGWKDPRNTFTLKMWRILFPCAKIINISRHGVDVAASLHLRSVSALNARSEDGVRKRMKESFFYKKGVYTDSVRCLELDGAFELWLDYVSQAENNRCDIEEDKYLNIKFEDLVAEPSIVVAKIADFVGVKNYSFKRVSDRMEKSRIFAYRDTGELLLFAEAKRKDLIVCGY